MFWDWFFFFLVLSLAKWTIKERNKWNHITNEDAPQAAAVSLTPICRAQASEAKCGGMRVCAIFFFSPWRSTSFLFKGLTSWPTAQGRPEHTCSSDGGVPRAQTSPGGMFPWCIFLSFSYTCPQVGVCAQPVYAAPTWQWVVMTGAGGLFSGRLREKEAPTFLWGNKEPGKGAVSGAQVQLVLSSLVLNFSALALAKQSVFLSSLSLTSWEMCCFPLCEMRMLDFNLWRSPPALIPVRFTFLVNPSPFSPQCLEWCAHCCWLGYVAPNGSQSHLLRCRLKDVISKLLWFQ